MFFDIMTYGSDLRINFPVRRSRILDAHEFILKEARALAREAAQRGDDGTNDLLVSQVIRAHELQTWFIGEHPDGV
jgi:starvation-inducible DNA-binding protein